MDRIRKIDTWLNRPQHAGYMFILPVLLVVVTFSIFPLLSSFYISMTDVNVFFTDTKFVGLDNFVKAFQDQRFLNAWKITILFVIFDVPVSICFSLLIASLVNKTSIWHKACRTVFILPLICSSTVTGLTWKIFMNPQVGWGIYALTQIGVPKFSMFGDPSIAIYGIVAVTIWRGFGVATMILVAAMQGVSQDLYEAASLDGANKAQQFFHVTLPGIAPILWYQLITRVVGSFQVFDLIYVITKGGPANSTMTLVNYIYNTSFATDIYLGYSTAMAETMFMVILAISIPLYARMIKQQTRSLRGV